MMLRTFFLVPFFVLLAACASTPNDIIKCGKNNYVASGSPTHPFGNYLKNARNVALLRANTFCQSKDRQILILKIVEGFPTHVTFRCLEAGDPELQQSAYKDIPIPEVEAKSLCH